MDTTTIVNEWFREKLACGPLARDTEALNQVHSALPALIARLAPAAADIATDTPAKAKPIKADPTA